MKRTILFTLQLLLTFTTFGQNTKHNELSFLVGNFTVEVFLPNGDNDWKKGGNGKASFSTILNGTFIREDIELNFPAATMHMSNTFGKDGRSGTWRMMALDQEYSVMDVYHGQFINNSFVFNNLESDIAAVNPKGEKINFRITFTKLSDNQNQSLVEMTTDLGNTWNIFSRQVFTRALGKIK